ncbi:MAG: aspartate aminotransferase family protein [Pseudomonadota bacterium]
MWPDPDTRSHAMTERAQRVFAGGSTRLLAWLEPYPIYIERGAGAYIHDVDGKAYLDLTNNFASLIHGHAHPRIVEAVTERVAKGTCFTLPTPEDVELAELLLERLEGAERIRFLNSGTEAVMMALRAARAHTGRPMIAKVEGAYHGMYDHAEVSLDSAPDTWGQTPRAVPYSHGTPEAVLADTLVLPFNDPEGAEAALREHGERLAGVLVDPVPATCGMIPATPEYLATLRRVCDELGAVLIFDEVVSFRYGYHGAQGVFGGEPDLTTVAKIIGGGFPVGAIAGREEVMRVFDHSGGKPLAPASGTFSANPVSMVAGRTSMEMLDPPAFEHLQALGDFARERIAAAMREAGFEGQVTGVGSNFLVHPHRRPIRDYRSNHRSDAERKRMAALQRGLLERGVFIAGTGAGFISSVTTKDDLDSMAGAMRETMAGL